LHALFGWDCDDPRHRDNRSGPWLRARVESLPFHPNSMTTARLNADIHVAVQARKAAEAQQQ
jgi:hypothetical protein